MDLTRGGGMRGGEVLWVPCSPRGSRRQVQIALFFRPLGSVFKSVTDFLVALYSKKDLEL